MNQLVPIEYKNVLTLKRLLEMAKDERNNDKIIMELLRFTFELCENDRHEDALKYTRLFSSIEGCGDLFFSLENLIQETYLYNILKQRDNEATLVSHFKARYKDVLGSEYEKIEVKQNPKHRPDMWLKHNNKKIPVEAKRGRFDKKALLQLQRYMDFYKCAYGIAVASELTVELPENILFISSFEIENELRVTPEGQAYILSRLEEELQ